MGAGWTCLYTLQDFNNIHHPAVRAIKGWLTSSPLSTPEKN